MKERVVTYDSIPNKRIEKNERVLINMHHSISDGTSVSILLDELSKLYNGKRYWYGYK